MIYEFTLVVDREPSQAELETLAAAGLDPIGAEGPHPALVHLAIDAGTVPAAIITAMRHIESLGVAVTAVQSADLVSLKDIAARTGRSYESVRKLAPASAGPAGSRRRCPPGSGPCTRGLKSPPGWPATTRLPPPRPPAMTGRSPPPTISFAPGISCPPLLIAPIWHSFSPPDPGPARWRNRSAGNRLHQPPGDAGNPLRRGSGKPRCV